MLMPIKTRFGCWNIQSHLRSHVTGRSNGEGAKDKNRSFDSGTKATPKIAIKLMESAIALQKMIWEVAMCEENLNHTIKN